MSLLDLDLLLAVVAIPFNWFVAGWIVVLYHHLPPDHRSAALRIRGQAQFALALASSAVLVLTLHNEGTVTLDATAVSLLRILLLLLLTAPAVGFAVYAWRLR